MSGVNVVKSNFSDYTAVIKDKIDQAAFICMMMVIKSLHCSLIVTI